MGDLASFTASAIGLLGWFARAFLPSWLIGSSSPHSHGTSRWANIWERKQLGRAARPERMHGDGVVLGWLGGRPLQSPAEDNVLLLGVQRSGKTSTVVVPTLLSWTGAVVATSTKEELVTMTAHTRLSRGPVWVFAPLDLDHSWVEELGLEPATWNPVAAAHDCAIAAEIADHFCAEGKRGPSAHWYLSAANLITGLLVCEQERGGDMRSVLARLNRTSFAEYLGVSEAVEDSTASELIFGFVHTPEKEAGSIASTARSSLSLWIDDRIARATAASSSQLDLDQLLAEGGSLYLVAPAEDAERCRPLFSALLQTLLRKATMRARAQSGVLSPRLLLALDEAANFARVPRLAGYASSGPGQGIQFLLCFHDLAQVEAGYGQEEARTIWNNCRARLLLPGQGDLKTLEQFSRAIGEETRIYQSQSEGERHSRRSEQRTGRALTSIDELRRLSAAVLLYANAPPTRLQMRRWDQVPAWRQQVLIRT
ncbi:MAG: type IV secretory system conjugative DNA transfer family protein [Candidatus Dormibacteraeota bacterium]|nr:type IV secretory system conjugative DNA transfer family protein [Candidatus Dormibacteraeota bacterium]